MCDRRGGLTTEKMSAKLNVGNPLFPTFSAGGESMPQILMSPVGKKAQVTLPKPVRQALGVKEKEDMVGFVIEGRRVALTRVEPLISSDPFTEEEWNKIEKLVAKKPTASFQDSRGSLAYLRKKLNP